jgi:hypothetical protein
MLEESSLDYQFELRPKFAEINERLEKNTVTDKMIKEAIYEIISLTLKSTEKLNYTEELLQYLRDKLYSDSVQIDAEGFTHAYKMNEQRPIELILGTCEEFIAELKTINDYLFRVRR